MNRKVFWKVLRIVILLGLGTVAALFIMDKIQSKESGLYEAPVLPVVIEQPHSGTISRTLTFNSYVEAADTIPVVAMVGGTVTEYEVREGESVEEGQFLMQIDPTPYALQVQQAEAALQVYEKSAQRLESLVAANAATAQALDELAGQRDAYKAAVELAKVQLDYATVNAPVSGTVLMSQSAKGSVVGQGTVVAAIADLNNLVVNVSIPEKYYSLINDNAGNISATVSHAGDVCEARVKSISAYVDPTSKTFVLTLSLKDAKNFIPGMFTSVCIAYETHENVPLLSQNARNTDGSAYIYDEQTRTAKYVLFTPEIFDNDVFEVPSEYADCWFITDGQGNLFDGQSVSVSGKIER